MIYLPHTNKLCLEYAELVPDHMSAAAYDQAKRRGRIVTHGRGGNGNTVYIEYEPMPEKLKQTIRDIYGDPYEYQAKIPIAQLVVPSPEARQYFADHVLDSGLHLDAPYQARYTRQAEWLDMMNRVLRDKRTLKDQLKINIDTFWQHVISLHQLDKPVNPQLPVTYDMLRKKLNSYKAGGYKVLVSKKFGNQNTRKVNAKIEHLIVSLYCMNHKPYLVEVCNKYHEFMKGKLEVVDMETGEVFNPKDFYIPQTKSSLNAEQNNNTQKKRKMVPYMLGESTVDYYIKKPANIQAIDQGRMRLLDWKAKYHPAVQRKSPQYAFSKITMDDRDLSFKDMSGQRSVKSYQIADVASGAIIGKAFSREKNVELLREALRDMMQLILTNGWGMPMEIEMERHLTGSLQGHTGQNENGEDVWIDDVLTEGVLFGNVRVCLGGNAREKRMEHIFRRKKYEFDNKRPGFQGRFYARLVTNRLNSDNDKIRYTYEQIVQNELDDIEAYNNSLHPKQELYPGMTRWEVLLQCQNPAATIYPAHTIMPYIGYKVTTSIRAGYVQVQYNSYRLPDINILNKLIRPEVDAYYIPGDNGIEKIYLYQDGKYISEGLKVIPFQEAKAEQTQHDLDNAEKQWGYQKAFDAMVKNKRSQIAKVGTAAVSKGRKQKAGAAPGSSVQGQVAENNCNLQKEDADRKEWKNNNWMQDESVAQRAIADI